MNLLLQYCLKKHYKDKKMQKDNQQDKLVSKHLVGEGFFLSHGKCVGCF
jgi:hypothetical protein